MSLRRRTDGSRKKGFTIVELLIITMVLSILTVLGSVHLWRAKLTANETAAQSSLTTFRNAMEDYRNLNGTYPAQLTELAAGSPAYISDNNLTAGTKLGYNFSLSNSSTSTYTVTAAPQTLNITGTRSFTVTESGEVAVVP